MTQLDPAVDEGSLWLFLNFPEQFKNNGETKNTSSMLHLYLCLVVGLRVFVCGFVHVIECVSLYVRERKRESAYVPVCVRVWGNSG